MRSTAAAFLLMAAGLAAQSDPAPPAAPSSRNSALAPTAQLSQTANPPTITEPATLSAPQKYGEAMKQVFDPARLAFFAVRAGIDQAEGTPSGWSQGGAGFGVRLASHFGSRLINENIGFGVAQIDHEDRRYFRMGEGSGWKRAKYAMRSAVVTRSEQGGTMPAYSHFIADFGTPFIAQQWHPNGTRGGRELRSGSIALGMDAASNLWKEFLPDLKHRHGK